jgi:hypothetical protein
MSDAKKYGLYVKDVLDTMLRRVNEAVSAVSHNCVTCEHFNEKELCLFYNARPPATVIVKGCDKYENEIPF